MSICRRGCDGSDIYLYEHCDDFICCHECNINDGESFKIKTDKEAIEHIKSHINNNDKVPQHAIDYFNGDLISNVTQEDIDKPIVKPEIPRVECRLNLIDKNGKNIVEFGLGTYLHNGEDKMKKVKTLFTSLERTVIKKIEVLGL